MKLHLPFIAAVLIAVQLCTLWAPLALAEREDRDEAKILAKYHADIAHLRDTLEEIKKALPDLPFLEPYVQDLEQNQRLIEATKNVSPQAKTLFDSVLRTLQKHGPTLKQIYEATLSPQNSIPYRNNEAQQSLDPMLSKIFSALVDFHNRNSDLAIAKRNKKWKQEIAANWKQRLAIYEDTLNQAQQSNNGDSLTTASQLRSDTVDAVAASILMTDYQIDSARLQTKGSIVPSYKKIPWKTALKFSFPGAILYVFYIKIASEDSSVPSSEKPDPTSAFGYFALSIAYFIANIWIGSYSREHKWPGASPIPFDSPRFLFDVYSLIPSLIVPTAIIAYTAARATLANRKAKKQVTADSNKELEKSNQFHQDIPLILQRCNFVLTVPALPNTNVNAMAEEEAQAELEANQPATTAAVMGQ